MSTNASLQLLRLIAEDMDDDAARQVDAAIAELDTLRAEVEALRKDAARYVWWRDRALRFRNDARRVLGNQPPMTVDEYDAETDAAMEPKP